MATDTMFTPNRVTVTAHHSFYSASLYACMHACKTLLTILCYNSLLLDYNITCNGNIIYCFHRSSRDDHIKYELDRQLRPVVVAANTAFRSSNYQRYTDVTDEKFTKMVLGLIDYAPRSVDFKEIPISFNARNWVRSKQFHIKAHLKVEDFCSLLSKYPSEDDIRQLRERQNVDAKAAKEVLLSDPNRRVIFHKSNDHAFSYERLKDSECCNHPFFLITPSLLLNQVRSAVQIFDKFLPSEIEGFSIHMFMVDAEHFNVFLQIDGNDYTKMFERALVQFKIYKEPNRKYR